MRVRPGSELSRLGSWPDEIAEHDMITPFTLLATTLPGSEATSVSGPDSVPQFSSLRCRGLAGYRTI